MPGFILHQGATLICPHTGQAQPMLVNPRVRVSGQPIVTQNCVHTIAGCILPPPPLANGPCVTAQWITAALRVRAGGIPVLLRDSQSVCAPTGAQLIVIMTQLHARAK
jgi:hypothetical protein